MPDQYFAGDHRKTLYRVTEDPTDVYFLEWARRRWSRRDNLFRVISPVGGEQNIEPVSKTDARAMVTARLNADFARSLIP